jgi:zinc protease
MRSLAVLLLGCVLAALALPAAADMAANAQRSQVAGIDVVTYHTGVKDVVVIVGALPAGDAMAEGGNAAIPTLTGMMLDRGTRALDQFAIAQQLESVGAEISYGVGPQSLEVRAKCLKKDLPLVLGLIAQELRTPALAQSEFAKARQQLVGMLDASLQSTEARSQEAFARAVFPPGNPNRPQTLEQLSAAAKSATLDELKSFHAKYYGPAHFTLVLVGDVNLAAASGEITKDFAGWTGGRDYLTAPETGGAGAAAGGVGGAGKAAGGDAGAPPHEIKIPLADKTSVSVLLGQATGLRYKDSDALALRVGTAVFGHGFTGRLMSTVRDKEGLTYDIGAAVIDDSLIPGAWQISASFAPSLLAKGIESSRRQLDLWWQSGITEQELAKRKQGLIGGYEVGLATTAGLAGTILSTIQRGYDLSWLDGYPKAVEALTTAQVNAAIKKHLDPGNMVLVEAGSLGAASK